VDEIAHLARLEFDEQSKAGILNDMNRMLSFVDKLNELDTTSVEPLIYMTDEKNILRPDEPEKTVTQKEALKNAPKKDSDYFKAPKVIEQNR
jgi:aspartyl-tRNA(Asn)/glutamyl-tRNA(Gln) amidotransferase subunit C